MVFPRSHYNFRTLIQLTLAVGFLGLLIVYVLWQARFLIAGPSITLLETPPMYGNERIVPIVGIAKNITKITINDRQIFTDANGIFREHIVLENGYTIVTIEASDRYGRTAAVQTPFIFTPASLAINP